MLQNQTESSAVIVFLYVTGVDVPNQVDGSSSIDAARCRLPGRRSGGNTRRDILVIVVLVAVLATSTACCVAVVSSAQTVPVDDLTDASPFSVEVSVCASAIS